jgi:hypothetical protein
MSDEPLDAIVVETPNAAANTSAESLGPAPGATSTWRQWIDDPWMLLGTLFFITAALGLPLLWMSKAFSVRAKVFWSLAVVAWTALILALFGLVMWWCYQQIQQALLVTELAS